MSRSPSPHIDSHSIGTISHAPDPRYPAVVPHRGITRASIGRVVLFQIAGNDLPRLATFYRRVFGWVIDDWSDELGLDYWGIRTGRGTEGIDGVLMPRSARPHMSPDHLHDEHEGYDTSPVGARAASQVTVAVDDLEEACARVVQHGGEVIGRPLHIPHFGSFQDVRDPEGTLLVLGHSTQF